jgi:hypothetical protein
MGRVRAATLVLAALAVGLLLAACGGGGSDQLLPGTTADQITSNLDQVRESYEAGNCEAAEEGVAEVSTEVDELDKVDAKLKKALRQGAAKLSVVVSSCRAPEEAEEEKAEEQAAEEEEQAQLEAEEEEEEAFAEEEAFEKEQKTEEREEKAEEKAQEKAEKEAEQPGPEEGEGPKGKGKGQEKQEEIESPVEGEEEVTPPEPGGGRAGGIGPGAEAGGP